MSGSATPPTTSIAETRSRLDALLQQIRLASKRTRRFSWYAWGMLIASYAGLALYVVVAVIVLAAYPGVGFCLGGVSCGVAIYLASQAAVVSIPLLLFVFVWSEALSGRRESRSLGAERVAPVPVAGGEAPAPWVEVIRSSQEQVTRMKSDVEVAFIPLFLGLLTVGLYVGEVVIAVLYPSGVSGLANFSPYFVALPILLLLIPLWRLCRNWIAGYQSLLQAQVDQISRLEGEFFRRFAGVDQLG